MVKTIQQRGCPVEANNCILGILCFLEAHRRLCTNPKAGCGLPDTASQEARTFEQDSSRLQRDCCFTPADDSRQSDRPLAIGDHKVIVAEGIILSVESSETFTRASPAHLYFTAQ